MQGVIISFLIFVCFFNPHRMFSQNSDSLFNYTEELISIIEENKEVDLKNAAANITNIPSDLNKIEKYLYYSHAFHEVEFYSRIREMHYKWVDEAKNNKTVSLNITPAIILKQLIDIVKKEKGEEYLGYLMTPYLILVEVTGLSNSAYVIDRGHSARKERKIGQKDIQVRILEILKGKSIYSVDETLTISYLEHWYRESPPIKFEIGKKYLLPIAHWRDSDSKKGIDHRYSLRLNLFDDNTLVEIRDHKVFYPLVPSSNNGQNWKDYKQNISRKFFNNDY